jgi:hypothetical protein
MIRQSEARTVHEGEMMDPNIASILHQIKAYGLKDNQCSFLLAYIELFGQIRAAAKCADIHWSTHFHWLTEDAKYREAFELAKECAKYTRLSEAYRRASEGNQRPVFYKGEICGHVQEYSDTLMNTFINGDFPESYGKSTTETRVKEDRDKEILERFPGREQLTDEELDLIIAHAKKLKEEKSKQNA